eukprot:1578650-Ditylum_brightwellii.AAC.1
MAEYDVLKRISNLRKQEPKECSHGSQLAYFANLVNSGFGWESKNNSFLGLVSIISGICVSDACVCKIPPNILTHYIDMRKTSHTPRRKGIKRKKSQIP